MNNQDMITWLKKYFSRIYFPILWTAIILVLLCLPGKMLPSEQGFKIPGLDKLVHITLFGGFVLLWCLHINFRQLDQKKRLQNFFYVFAIGVALGITMEFVQKYYIPNRDFSLGDIIADMIGAGLGYGICNITLVVENDGH